jgi:bacterioferritin (cytochrome b1)
VYRRGALAWVPAPQSRQRGNYVDQEYESMAVSNLEYNILTVLQSKLEGIAVYDKYIADCGQSGDDECRRLFEDLKRQDEQNVERLREVLSRVMNQGKVGSGR